MVWGGFTGSGKRFLVIVNGNLAAHGYQAMLEHKLIPNLAI